jgi:ComF family protein
VTRSPGRASRWDWKRLRDALFDLVFPPRCVGCRRYGEWLCRDCSREIEFIEGPLCPRCGRPGIRSIRICPSCRYGRPPIDGIRSTAYFEGVLREAIHRLKYQGVQVLARPLGQLMVEQWEGWRIPADVIVPVPLHATRLAERGFNQAALLATQLERGTGLPVETSSLVRVRPTLPQTSLDVLARRDNVRGAFRCLDSGLAGRQVVLVDDVCTTGATLNACSVALRDIGVRSVWAYTLSRPRP